MLVEGVAVKGVYRQKMNLDFSGIVGRSSLFLGFGKDVGGRGGFVEWIFHSVVVYWLLLCPTSMN